MEYYVKDLGTRLSRAVKSAIAEVEEAGILFSGGLDSSLIAFLAGNLGGNAIITLYTVGTPDSHDLRVSQKASQALAMPLKSIEVSQQDIIEALPRLADVIHTRHPVKLTFELPIYLCMAKIEERIVLSGQGADELFGGYARYLKMETRELENALRKDLDSLLKNDILMDRSIAEHFNKDLFTPYLDENVVDLAMQIPVEAKVKGGERKIILKEAARDLGLSEKLVESEKKAAQYSSGLIRELKLVAKKEGLQVNELISSILEDV